MKAVIDTNVIVSSFRGGNPRRVIDLLDEGAFKLCVSKDIIEEYTRILARMRIERTDVEKILYYCGSADTVGDAAVTPRIFVVQKDPDDNKFIECAVALKADYIVTGDHALLEIGEYEGIQIVTPREFVELAEHAKRKK